jgi:polyhydroxyalkanoate synthesis regulator phasin
MDENVVKFISSMVKKGKLTQTEADAKIAKHDKKETAKKNYKANGKSMKKDELIALLDELTE